MLKYETEKKSCFLEEINHDLKSPVSCNIKNMLCSMYYRIPFKDTFLMSSLLDKQLCKQ